jgi:hypothetical protein
MTIGKSSACRQAIEKALKEVKKRHADGNYGAANEPLEDLFLVSRDPACIKRKPASKSAGRKRSTKHRTKQRRQGSPRTYKSVRILGDSCGENLRRTRQL